MRSFQHSFQRLLYLVLVVFFLYEQFQAIPKSHIPAAEVKDGNLAALPQFDEPDEKVSLALSSNRKRIKHLSNPQGKTHMGKVSRTKPKPQQLRPESTEKETQFIEQEGRTNEQKVILATFAFGNQSVAQKRFRMWVKTAEHSGVDYAIIGDAKPPFELPANIKWYNLTWDGLVELTVQKLFQGTRPFGELPNAPVRKICDFKPLVAYLMPHVVEGYDWWGHVDNDMVMGNLTHFFPQNDLKIYDFISGIGKKKAWGPLMFYRNTPAVNELFFHVKRRTELKNIFFAQRYAFFDEWANYNMMDDSISMHGLIKQVAIPRLHLKWKATKGRVLGDNSECFEKYQALNDPEKVPLRCGECVFKKGVLVRQRDGQEMAACHYQASKKLFQEESLRNQTKLEKLLAYEEFRVAYREGFDYILE